MSSTSLAEAVKKRRTFAIISHPDAGKTTLTEKLLLYSGMLRTAGLVKGRKGRKSATSDWMGMEQERGISITSSAMQFPYKDTVINVLDTPGHQDFSEDTYRTLTAADAAVMVVDAGKGIQAQTRKLFEVCRLRGIPVLTFINKMDMPGRPPLDLMGEVEEALGIHAAPMNWPIGSGKSFVGVVSCQTQEVDLFTKTAAAGAQKAARESLPLSQLEASHRLDDDTLAEVLHDMELIEVAGTPFEFEAFRKGELTPMFFGSALTNFGVEPFFDAFVELAPPPSPRGADTASGERIVVDPVETPFSAFVFKIQANMDPRHRDSVAFLRICSGQFDRDMVVRHDRLEKKIRLARPHSLLAGSRETLDCAYPGDVVGIINPGQLSIGDTLSIEGGFSFDPPPVFQPEIFARLSPMQVNKRKAFDKGLAQLVTEGTAQTLQDANAPQERPFIAAVGRLQFDVLQYRLKQEYNVETLLEPLPYTSSAWLVGDLETFKKPIGSMLTYDRHKRPVVLFRSTWEKNFAIGENPDHQFLDMI